jgi:UDP-2-acetamido-2-deoxy-ribo-hexuluronate aminotransferase
VHYPLPLHKQLAYARYSNGSLAVSESVASRVISLPLYPDMSEQTQSEIVVVVHGALLNEAS